MTSNRRAHWIGQVVRGGRSRDRRRSRGQALVEFAFVFPLFILIFFSLIEFAFAFDALLWLNAASRDASLLGAEAGAAAGPTGADCTILLSIEGKLYPGEKNVTGSANPADITVVKIFKASKGGTPTGAQNLYNRTGTMNCVDATGGAVTLPYTLAGGEGYPQASRCNQLAGCGVSGASVDVIGVEITYAYHWMTPFPTILPWTGPSFTLVKSNVMRMEPVL